MIAKVGIISGILGILLILNSCSCENWFNNGCPFSNSYLGQIFGGGK